jgi:hypothetical protein
MNSRKRILVISASAVLLFVAIAAGPVYKRTVTPVHAGGPSATGVFILECAAAATPGATLNNLTPPIAVSAEWSADFPIASLPPTLSVGWPGGSVCASVIDAVNTLGYVRQDVTPMGVFPYTPGASSPSQSVIFTQWVFVPASK